ATAAPTSFPRRQPSGSRHLSGSPSAAVSCSPTNTEAGAYSAPSLRPSEPDGNNDCPAQAYQVLFTEASDVVAKLRSLDRRDLVDHHAAELSKTIPVVRLDAQPDEGCLRGVGGEGAERHRVGGV